MKFRTISILEKDPNKKGDLFGRLMGDLFHSLGYDEPRLNIHKSGREIDLNSYHRTEDKIAIAECKAHIEPIGGSDINKFIGVIDAEKRKLKKNKSLKGFDVAGYFISLSGFKETAIEQENEFEKKRIILIKPEKIVEELINGRIIVSIEKGISEISIYSPQLTLVNHVDLLAYHRGWIWAYYFSNSDGQDISHVAFVHAEGKLLIKDLAEEIIAIDKNISGKFTGLTLLNVDNPVDAQQHGLDEAKQKYFTYLQNELGEIQFEGLPTDKEAGAVKVKLENIFVPLYLTQIQANKKDELIIDDDERKEIGEILSTNTRLAILAKPGGGKSTLIKRIAIAYAFPDRRIEIKDKLPDRSWFPIFLRCRELGERVTLSITEIINGIPIRAEIHSCTDGFSVLTSQALQNGTAMLLVDGLDEIADDRNRISFVNQLRTFLATYPTINIIVTSREAGFRVVGGALANYCEHYRVSNLMAPEIEELSIKWHKAIIDESENTIKEAIKISELIIKDSRIKVLAENPLLLTTLLFVKRWAGYLPTKKSVLYQEMIKLLMVTWNVEGHEQLDIEEAEPQLAYVAFWMTKNQQQTISEEDLNNCLIDARKQMPEILGYTNISPSEFIKRVESRSSLLIMSGHKKLESGKITAVYEFLHLSFQEYLTAKAVVKKFIPQLDSKSKIVDIIKPYINAENWKEIIPIVAVLLERETKELIEELVNLSRSLAANGNKGEYRDEKAAPILLGSCLANEIQVSPDLLKIAIEWYAKNKQSGSDKSRLEIILKNKFGATFRSRVMECFLEKYEDKYSFTLGSLIAKIFAIDLKKTEEFKTIPDKAIISLGKDSKEEKCAAILGMMEFAFRLQTMNVRVNRDLENKVEKIFTKMLELLRTKDDHYYFCICWCTAWCGHWKIFPKDLLVPFVNELIEPWVKTNNLYNYKRVTSWALTKILTPELSKDEIRKVAGMTDAINSNYRKPENEFDKLASIFLGTIIGEKWNLNELTDEFNLHNKRQRTSDSFFQFAEALKITLKSKRTK